MSDQALREELDQAVDRVIKKLDRKTLVEGFPEVFFLTELNLLNLIFDVVISGGKQRVSHRASPASAEPAEAEAPANY